jgi:hypothetical protein
MIWRVVYRTANENHNQKRPDIIMIFIKKPLRRRTVKVLQEAVEP